MAYVIGSGLHLPERAVDNEEFGRMTGISPQEIFKSSGIASRRWAEPGTPTSELAAVALGCAIADAQVSRDAMDYLLAGTMTPDRFIPGMAPAVQHRLSLARGPCLDIRAGCCNMLYGLQLARALVESRAAGLVGIGLADIQSPWLRLTAADARISMLFGDGASACLVSAAPRPKSLEIIDVEMHADGAFCDDLGVRSPGTLFGDSAEDRWPRMNGQTIIVQASRRMAESSRALIAKHRLEMRQVRWLVPHQANQNLILGLCRNLGLPADSLISVLRDCGNTSSASMGIALDRLWKSDLLSDGDYLLLPAFGAGITWGTALLRARWSNKLN